ncbi:MAG: hypothetical protein ACKVS6_01675 [Planctomycetota bacterium]
MSRRVFYVISVLVIPAFVSCERSGNELLAEAQKAIQKTPPDVQTAKRYLDEVLENTANNPGRPDSNMLRREALMLRGSVFRQIGLLSAAESDYRTILDQIDSADAAVLIQIATVLADRATAPDDLDRSIVYATKAASITRDSSAQIAAGVAYYKRGTQRRAKLTNDLSVMIGGANVIELITSVRTAISVERDDPRAIAAERVLDTYLEFRTVDSQRMVAGAIAAARDDLQNARKFLFAALEFLPRFDVLTIESLLPLLRESNDLPSALWIAQMASKVQGYWENPRVIEAYSSILYSAQLKLEAANVFIDYINRGPYEMIFRQKKMALQYAAESGNADALERMLTAIRDRLRKDSDAKLLLRLLAFYDGILLYLKKEDHKKVADNLAAFLDRRDAEFSDLIATGALIAAKEYIAAGLQKDALRIAELGVSSAPENLDLHILRGYLLTELNGEPLTIGRDMRFAIIGDPKNADLYFPIMRKAANAILAKTGQDLDRIEEESSNRGEGFPKGYKEGWMYYVFARDYLNRKKPKEAAACALETVARDAAFTPALITFGLANAQMGGLIEARKEFTRSLDELPKDPLLLREINESGAAPSDITLRLIAARPEVEGRIVLSKSLFENGNVQLARSVLAPLSRNLDAPDNARILAARLVLSQYDGSDTSSGPEELVRELLKNLSADAHAGLLRDQTIMEAAILAGNRGTVEEYAKKVAERIDWLETPHLVSIIQHARELGRSNSAVPAARLIANLKKNAKPEVRAEQRAGIRSDIKSSAKNRIKTDVSNIDFLFLLGCLEYEAKNFQGAVEAFDRLCALSERREHSILLGLALSRQGDLAGVAEALGQLRADWGIAPIDAGRAVLATLANLDPLPEEASAIFPNVANPMSIAQLAALYMLKVGGTPGADVFPRQEAWVDSVLQYAAGSMETAGSILHLSLVLPIPGAEQAAVELIKDLRKTAGDHAILDFAQAELLRRDAKTSRRAAELYISVVKKFSDMEVAWKRAVDIYRSIEATDDYKHTVLSWVQLHTESQTAVLFHELLLLEEQLKDPTKIDSSIEKLTILLDDHPRQIEILRVLLNARLAKGPGPASLESARKLYEACKDNSAALENNAKQIVQAYLDNLNDIQSEAFDFATKLKISIPNSPYPILLLASFHHSAFRQQKASEEILEFLRANNQVRTIDNQLIREFVSLVKKMDPVGASEIAKLSIASNASDWERWEIFIDTHMATGRKKEVTEYLDAYHTVMQLPESRIKLALLLSDILHNPKRTLELLANINITGKPVDAEVIETAAAKARALRSMDRNQEAIELLESILGSPMEVPFRARIENWEMLATDRYKRPSFAPLVFEMGLALGARALPGDADMAFVCLKQAALSLPKAEAARAESLAKVAHHMRVFLRHPRTVESKPAVENK